jgi:hypothetical protein
MVIESDRATLLMLLHRARKRKRALFRRPAITRERMDWLVRMGQLNERQFRRRYRMGKSSFQKLSRHIAPLVHGAIACDVQLSIALRYLSGAASCDVEDLHGVAETTARLSFERVLRSIDAAIPMHFDCEDELVLRKIAAGFAVRSEGVLTGIVGAVDGVHIRVRKPLQNGASYW